jgi:hypothetical protein
MHMTGPGKPLGNHGGLPKIMADCQRSVVTTTREFPVNELFFEDQLLSFDGIE